jgi:hypothetical protein
MSMTSLLRSQLASRSVKQNTSSDFLDERRELPSIARIPLYTESRTRTVLQCGFTGAGSLVKGQAWNLMRRHLSQINRDVSTAVEFGISLLLVIEL